MNESESIAKHRNEWIDFEKRQEFEHELINRKAMWLLTSQSLLFAAYGVSFDKDVPLNAAHSFRMVISAVGVSVAAAVGISVMALIYSKWRSYVDYRNYFGNPARALPPPLDQKQLQWGVRTWNSCMALTPDLLLPWVFFVGWLYLIPR